MKRKRKTLTARELAQKAADRHSAKNKGKKTRMVKISDHPVTYKEIEVVE